MKSVKSVGHAACEWEDALNAEAFQRREFTNDGLDWGSRSHCVDVLVMEVCRTQNTETTMVKEAERGLSVSWILRILLITVILLLAQIAFARPNTFSKRLRNNSISGEFCYKAPIGGVFPHPVKSNATT